jgi:hypothetical protein
MGRPVDARVLFFMQIHTNKAAQSSIKLAQHSHVTHAQRT